MSLTKKSQGATRFDFAVSICVIAALASLLLFSLNRAQNQVESVMMDTDLANMRWQLRELWAHHNATSQSLSSKEISDTNPLRLLTDHPKNYLGESSNIPAGIRPAWYFDTTSKRLVYLFSDDRQIRYRLTNTTAMNRASVGAIGGMDLLPEE